MEAREIKKLYYSISEVSEITGLKQYVLRYWETEFNQLNPKKNSAGNRVYKSLDIDIILKIKSLLYDRKFTIKGAKQRLKRQLNTVSDNSEKSKIVKLSTNLDLKSLREIKTKLSDLIKLIEQYKD
tara:strand:- start:317 stop:694 length:378 start_codon:yes stop_codon:yes gene_type:complete